MRPHEMGAGLGEPIRLRMTESVCFRFDLFEKRSEAVPNGFGRWLLRSLSRSMTQLGGPFEELVERSARLGRLTCFC